MCILEDNDMQKTNTIRHLEHRMIYIGTNKTYIVRQRLLRKHMGSMGKPHVASLEKPCAASPSVVFALHVQVRLASLASVSRVRIMGSMGAP